MIATKGERQLEQQHAPLFDIDSNLDRPVKKIELLSYLNPLNTEKAK